MDSFFQIILLVFLGTLLLWFGYTLFISINHKNNASAITTGKRRTQTSIQEGTAGSSRTCPVCSARLLNGERVKSSAFPALSTKTDRIMHISGCPYCLSGQRKRYCPVCGVQLKTDEVLIARMFEKPGRSHVHVLGCSRCRKPRYSR